jgi:hypothetical protein
MFDTHLVLSVRLRGSEQIQSAFSLYHMEIVLTQKLSLVNALF